MSIAAVLSYAAAYFSVIVAVSVLLRDRHSIVHRTFAVGMFLLAAEEVFRGLSHGVVLPGDVFHWQRRVIAVSALIPGVWLAFSLSFARANSQGFLFRWKWVLLAAVLVPVPFVAMFRQSIFTGSIYLQDAARWNLRLGWLGQALNIFLFIVSLSILFNLERTVRSSTGRVRWQIKFMALGVGGLFASRIYVASQSLIFSSLDTGFGTINAVALIAANVLFAISLVRGRLLDVDVYLSTATIQNSFTIILAGVYLLAVGLLARFARYVVPNRGCRWMRFLFFSR